MRYTALWSVLASSTLAVSTSGHALVVGDTLQIGGNHVRVNQVSTLLDAHPTVANSTAESGTRTQAMQASVEEEVCENEMDCSLGGDCVGGKCVCIPTFTGPKCAALNLQPATGDPLFTDDGDHDATWGGNVVQDPTDGVLMCIRKSQHACSSTL